MEKAIAANIINIGIKCSNYSVQQEVIISATFRYEKFAYAYVVRACCHHHGDAA